MQENKMPYAGKKAILVDDDHDFVDIFKIYLENMGFSVNTGYSHEEGEKLIFEEKYDIAVFDLMMEKADSGFVLSYVSKKKNPDVPVLVITSVTASTGLRFDNYNKEKCVWVKADEILDKNVRPEQLRWVIEKHLPL